jgi:hypothetical protein
VEADGALFELGQVGDLVHRLLGVNLGGRREAVDVEGVGRLDARVGAPLVAFGDAIVLHAQSPHGHRHPAVLVVVVVYLRTLPHVPAHGHEFEEGVLEDEVARVVVAAEVRVAAERVGLDGVALEVVEDPADGELGFADGAQAREEGVD